MNQVRKFNQAAAKLGFTLIELSIVLVIIGLIVGGILVGQDLIKAAEIRATVSQMEKYATAVNTFRSKYNGLPGDLLNASNFGFDAGTRAGTNGNAQIESSPGTAGTFGGEISCFWDDLSIANLIADSLNASATCGTAWSPAVLSSVTPVAKLGRGNYIMVGSLTGINYWAVTGLTSITTGATAASNLLTNAEAFQIDSKVDDGAPTSGSVVATNASGGESQWITMATVGDTAAATAAMCVLGNNTYNFLTNNGNNQVCSLRLRSNF